MLLGQKIRPLQITLDKPFILKQSNRMKPNITNHYPINMHFLVVGAVRNCGKHLSSDVKRIDAALSPFGSIKWLIVESDSDDDTLKILDNLANDHNNFGYISHGKLKESIPLRTERIAFCRNSYVDCVNKDPKYHQISHIIVADFDGINDHISADSIESSWKFLDWDVCTANQLGPYYDVFALRHKIWCPNDCWAQEEFLREYGKNPYLSIKNAVHSKMIKIPKNSAWIKVDSAFGGFAIYKMKFFKTARYVGLTNDGKEVCEHVAFNKNARDNGAKIFINPNLINAHYTEHTKILTKTGHIKLAIISVIKYLIMKIGGADLYKTVKKLKSS